MGKNLLILMPILLLLLALLFFLKPTLKQVTCRWAPLQCETPRPTIYGSAPTFSMSQQTTTSMFGQGYMHTAPSFSMPNLGLTRHTSEGNVQTYANTNENYQDTYSTIAYTDHIQLPDSSAGFFSNHAYHNVTRYNTYG
jgi:hypothetical protein